jgi:hypothetical protein
MTIYQRMLESAGVLRAPETGAGSGDGSAGAGAAGGAGAGTGATSVFGEQTGQQQTGQQQTSQQQTSQQQTSQQQTSQQQVDGWFSKLSPEDRAWAESKGWKADTDPFAILHSYQNLEKVFGADKAGRTVMLPKDANDKAAIDAIYDKLGRPKSPDGYQIDLPNGADPGFANAARGWFHKAGLTADQAKAVTESYKALELDAVQRVQTEHAQQVEGLQKEWGAQFDRKVEVAKAALKAAGITEAQTKAVESALGPATAAKAFEFFGRNYAEAGPPGNETRTAPGFTNLTPAAASQKMDQLRGDPNFMARYDHADPKVRAQAIEEMDALAKIAVNAKV